VSFVFKPLQLGVSGSADLIYTLSSDYGIVSTQWTESILFQGSTSQKLSLSGSPLSTSFESTIPGTYVITAYTTYQATHQGVAPLAPTAVSGSITIPTPDHVNTESGLGEPASPNSAIQISDYVSAGGFNIGPFFSGLAQENISTITYYTGVTVTSTVWDPNSPTQNFYFAAGNSTIEDRMFLGGSIPAWNSIPVGTTICDFTQQLRFQINFLDSSNTLVTKKVSLGSLYFSWVKNSATTWEVLGG
jgi:hypothetical protein